MRVSAIINTIDTYRNYQTQLRNLKAQWVEADAFDDDIDKKQIEEKIDDVNKEIGKFLNLEI